MRASCSEPAPVMGHIADDEVGSLVTALGRLELYQRTTPQQFNSMMDPLLGLLKRGGPEKMLDELAPVIPPGLNECVFANACNIVLADCVVEEDEREFLVNLMNKLELDKDRCLKIIKVMVIRNKG